MSKLKKVLSLLEWFHYTGKQWDFKKKWTKNI